MGGFRFDHGCEEYGGLERRTFLKAGALSALGLTLPDLLSIETAQAAPRKEVSCILLWLRGGPSSIDMWDLKPEAPAEVRGPFSPIKTNVPGIEISEHLPLLAKIADKYCLVRSLTHGKDGHEAGSHVNATGWNTWPTEYHPMYGTVIQKLRGYRGVLPPHIHLPEPPQEYSGGQHYLSKQDLPFVVSCMNDLDLKVKDVSLGSGISPGRFERRQHLLASSSLRSAPLAGSGDLVRSNDVFYERAFDILAGAATRAAFDVTREPEKLRDRYGRGMLAPVVTAQGTAGDVSPNEFNRSIVGQGLLMARRLVEAGVRFVTVVGRGWDTHGDNFNRLKDGLLPFVDRAVHGLLTDLDERGMLDSTLVIVSGDFNRTPKINKDAGRDHWGNVMTLFLAGAGVPGGTVIGASDPECGWPAERPVTPGDVAATIYQKLGISPHAELVSPEGRPYPLLPEGATAIRELV